MNTAVMARALRMPAVRALGAAACMLLWFGLTAAGASAAPPVNDDFADAAPFGAVPGAANGSNVEATLEPGEPNHGGGSLAQPNSVWWTWTADRAGRFRVDTCDSLPAFHSHVGVYTGNAVNALTDRVAVGEGEYETGECADRDLAAVAFDAVPGQKYYIAVASDQFDEDTSANIVLNIRETQPNDNFALATNLGSALGRFGGSNVEATREAGEPVHGPGSIEQPASVWWRWTAPRSGTVRIDTCDSLPAFNSNLGVYTGPSVGALADAVARDEFDVEDPCPGFEGLAAVEIEAAAGQTYSIAVAADQFDEDTSGNIVLRLSYPACDEAQQGLTKAKKKFKKSKKKVKKAKKKVKKTDGAKKAKKKLKKAKKKKKKAKNKVKRGKSAVQRNC